MSLFEAGRSCLRRCRDILRIEAARVAASFHRADVAIFHKFVPPPQGGAHQFLRALWGEFERRGLRVEGNTISPTTRSCLCNSFNFDAARLRRLRRAGCRVVHRVDGPIGVYRGWDDGTDRRIWETNATLADASIFQSAYSLARHRELGLEFRHPVVILNSPDPRIFHPGNRQPSDRQRRLRLIATSWSDNPNKGFDVYARLEERLDWSRFDFTFVGRSPLRFSRIRMLAPLPPEALAEELRCHDIYIAASRHDPCSMAVVEALACGLPVLYRDSGGHPELVGEAGCGFTHNEELLPALDRLVNEYEMRRALIRVTPLAEVADRYLAVMGMRP